MWSDNDIDKAFQRLSPPETVPTPFPLDAWLRLESGLDEAVIARAVRRKLWRFFAAEVAVAALVALGWLLWPSAGAPATGPTVAAAPKTTVSGTRSALESSSSASSSSPASARAGAATPPAAMAATSVVATGVATARSASAGAGVHAPVATAVAAASRPVAAAAKAHPLAAKAYALAAIAAPNHNTRPTAGRTESGAAASRPSAGAAAALASRGTLNGSPVVVAKAARASQGARHAALEAEAASDTRSSAGLGRSKRSVMLAGSGELAIARGSRRQAGRATRLQQQEMAARGGVAKATAAKTRTTSMGPDQAIGAAAGNGADHARTSAPTLVAAMPTRTTDAGDNPGAAAAGLPALAVEPVPLAAIATPALPAPLATVAVAAAPAVPTPVRQPRLYVGLVAAADVSTVKFAGVASPLLNIGVTIDYQLTNRLRLSTGLMRSNKQYVAKREDYDWSGYTSGVYQRSFTDVDGTCTVLDVPLNLRYDLLVRPACRLVSTVGLSSFFLQHEKYSYDWTDATGTHNWTRSATNENRNLLSILNLALGVEYGLGTRWSLLAEPYVKVPLAGVGMGKVKLLSAGVYLGVKYGF